jgi:hypothetical protein
MMRSLRSASFVPMVKAAGLWKAHHTSPFWWLDAYPAILHPHPNDRFYDTHPQ